MRGRTSRGHHQDSRGTTRFLSLPTNALRVVAHIFAPSKPEGKAASITYFAEHQARENTRPRGNVDRRY